MHWERNQTVHYRVPRIEQHTKQINPCDVAYLIKHACLFVHTRKKIYIQLSAQNKHKNRKA